MEASFEVEVINMFINLFKAISKHEYPFKNYEVPGHLQFSFNSWSDISNLEFNPDGLDITNPIDTIEQQFNEYGVIILRPYKGEKKLVIGCGNKPLANCGGYPFATEKEELDYHTDHHHEECYTINPEPAYNPSVVGFFSINEFGNIPDYAF